MTDTIRKRREQRAVYDAALASRRASSAACPACHDAGLINNEDAELPCPYCRPDEAREAARGARP